MKKTKWLSPLVIASFLLTLMSCASDDSNGSGSGSGDGSSIADAIDVAADFETITINIDANETALYAVGDYTTGDLPTTGSGPSITSISGSDLMIRGGSARYEFEFDSDTDFLLVKLTGDTGYYSVPVDGTSLVTALHLSNEFNTRLGQSFNDARDGYCNGGSFDPPSYADNSRNQDFYDSTGSLLLDQLCDGDDFKIPSSIADEFSEKDIETFFPARLENALEFQAVSGSNYGAVEERDIAAQKVTKGPLQVSLFFDKATDLDIHTVQPNGERIYFANTTTSQGGLDLDSNPACSIDNVNNENVTWASPASGNYGIFIHYWQACTDEDVYLVVTSVDESTAFLRLGVIQASNEHEYWLIGSHEY